MLGVFQSLVAPQLRLVGLTVLTGQGGLAIAGLFWEGGELQQPL